MRVVKASKYKELSTRKLGDLLPSDSASANSSTVFQLKGVARVGQIGRCEYLRLIFQIAREHRFFVSIQETKGNSLSRCTLSSYPVCILLYVRHTFISVERLHRFAKDVPDVTYNFFSCFKNRVQQQEHNCKLFCDLRGAKRERRGIHV